MYKKSIIGAALVLTFLTPSMSQAASSLTESQINAVLGLLQSFNVDAATLANVTAALKGQQRIDGDGGVIGSTNPPFPPPGKTVKMLCIDLIRNLSVGSQGDDVRKLQNLLAADPDTGFTDMPTGYYGPRTLEAMKRFQMKYEIASSSTGVVGPMTREFFNRKCGKGLTPLPPVNTIDSISTSTDRAPM